MSAFEMMAFKSVHVLNDLLKATDEHGRQRLKPTHYACVLINGRAPVWGIWTVTWRLVMFAGSRAQIEQQYPDKVWRVTMASWLLNDAEGNYKDIGKRITMLEQRYGGHIDRPEPAATHD